MEENRPKITWRILLPEFISVLLAVGGIWGISLFHQKSQDVILSNIVFGVAGVAVLGYCVRQAYLDKEFDYDNGEHCFRFWVCFWIGLAGAFVCTFLPTAGWPYLTIFVSLALFSNISIGILAGAVLLVISVLLCGAQTVLFLLYFLSGLFATVLFRHLDRDFKIGKRLVLSLFCLLLCETAGIVLLANAKPNFESFVIPTVNIFISGILLVGVLKLFSSLVIYKYREKYLELNDTENPLLVKCRNESKEDYMHGVHTEYFCERIAGRLDLDVEALKCAGYYHRLCARNQQILAEEKFPPKVQEILLEFYDKKTPVKRKETAVLVSADVVVNTVQHLVEKSQGRSLDYDYIIDSVFKHFSEAETFAKCDITLYEIGTMCQIYKEEKLYYDFLR